MTGDLLRGPEMAHGEALQLALSYAHAGIPAFPVKLTWDDKKRSTNKVPLTEHGFKDASCDLRAVRLMFNKTRLSDGEALAVGLWPGPAGYVVLDVDTKGGAHGDDELARLEADRGALPDSLRVTTASGGEHIWLRKNGQAIGNTDLAPDVEVRADAGYVIAPGVWCPWGEWAWDGGIGILEGGRVEDAPDWLLDTLAPGPTANVTGTKDPWRKVDPAELDPADRAALAALERLGGHHAFHPRGKTHIEITRPGKRAGTSATIGYVGPGVVKVFSPNWRRLETRVYDADQLDAIADGQAPSDDRGVVDEPAADGAGLTSWEPVDLTAALAGEDVPPATVLARVDGVALLYPGRTHMFQGESESLKTWAALIAAAQELEHGNAVLWIDYEDDEVGVTQRLRSLGVAADVIRERFTYIRPDEPLNDRQGRATPGNVRLGQLLEQRTYTLAVIDGTTEAMATEGLNLIDNTDIATWARRLAKRLAATGAAVTSLDHVVKNRGEGVSNRYAIGGQHKLAGLTGAAYRFDIVRPLARATGSEPVTGAVTSRWSRTDPATSALTASTGGPP
jgi:hypothetical protein